MGNIRKKDLLKYVLGSCLAITSVCVIPVVHAAIPDGTYTGTVDGQFFSQFCLTSDVDPSQNFSGASATLTVNGSNVTLSIAKANEVSISASGTQGPSTLNLNATFAITIPGSESGDGTDSVTPVYSVSGPTVSIDFTMLGPSLSGPPGSCSTLIVDWNPFTVTLLSVPSTPNDDPSVKPSSNITGADTENLDRAISSFVVPVQNRTRGFHLESLRGNQSTVSTFSPSLIENGIMVGGATGMNAGDSAVLYGAWTSYSYSDFENDFIRTKYDGDRHTVMVGADVSPWERTLFGVAIGWENSDFDTDFNLGEQDTDGFTIFPYFGGLLTDTWSVDFGFGYSNLNTDQFRTDPTTSTIISSSPEADRWFGMLNLNGLTTYGNWIIGGRLGFLYAQEEQDGFTESDGTVVSEFKTELGQWNLGADVSYSYGNFEPFAKLTYENDFNQTELVFSSGAQPSDDDDNFLIGAGVRYFNQDNVSGYFEWYKRLGRNDVEEDTFTLSIRVDF